MHIQQRILRLSILGAMAWLTLSAVTLAANESIPPVTFSDGAIATAWSHCGDTDLCATIQYTDGEKVSIYSEGAALCQPYLLHFVRTSGDKTVYEYSRTINHSIPTTSLLGVNCGRSLATQMVLDHGLVHMTVVEEHDGTLTITFSVAQPRT